ncbi:sigma-54-dependent transcriptional regulator [Adonisia turfae]
MKHAASVLVVDDSAATREVLERNIRAEGHRVSTAQDVAEALQHLGQADFDLVVTDLRMPGADGMELVRHVRDHCRGTGVIMVTGFATVHGAVSAMQDGADDYLSKPFSDDELRDSLRKALEKAALRRAFDADQPIDAPDGMIGSSPPMHRVYRLIGKASGAAVPVLISGESGTGKELVARAIHYRGPRAASPFLAVNCAAIPETLIESELFGHRKGAFTGATGERQGFFAAADGGTLFLDEVAELTPVAQAKLLRVLQEGTVQAVGSDEPRGVDVRIVAATNKDLEESVRVGSFREDLLFRLNVLPIEVPPLRDRGDDVVMLLKAFLHEAARQCAMDPPELTNEAIDAMRRYPWPGNVRELQNIVQRLVVFADAGVIDTVDLPAVMRYVSRGAHAPGGGLIGSDRPLREIEAAHIRAVLERVGGNKTKAAAILGIDRKSLRSKLKPDDNARALTDGSSD